MMGVYGSSTYYGPNVVNSFPHQPQWISGRGIHYPQCCTTVGALYPSGHQAPSFAVPFSYTPGAMSAHVTESVQSPPEQQPQQQQVPPPVQVGTVPIQVPYAPPAGAYCGFGMGGGFSMGSGYGTNNYSPYYSTYPSGYTAGGYGYYGGGYGYGLGYNYGGRY